MDVVKDRSRGTGGRVETVSPPGHGTTFRIYLPLTLAVTQTLLTRTGTVLHAVPSTMIEQVPIQRAALPRCARGEVEWQGTATRSTTTHLLGDARRGGAGGTAPVLGPSPRSGSQRVAVQVDEPVGQIRKSSSRISAASSRVVGTAGATVLGDGQVVLILNPVALASRKSAATVHSVVPVAVALVMTTAATLPTMMVTIADRADYGRLLPARVIT